MRPLVFLLLPIIVAACRDSGTATAHDPPATQPSASASSSSAAKELVVFGLKLSTPPEWRHDGTQPGAFPKEKFTLPKAEGDAEDGQLSIYQGQMGPKDANVQRWIGQFEQSNGKSSADVARVSDLKSGPFSITFVDVAGTFVDAPMGGPAKPKQTGYRLLAAVVEGPKGPWYFKATGPEKTMARWRDGFERMLSTLKAE